MTKKQGILIEIALVLLFTWIAIATSSASTDVEIYAFDQNHDGYSVEPKPLLIPKRKMHRRS